MTKDNLNNKTKSPRFIAFHVREGTGGKAFFTKIGAAWSHGDDNGFNLILDCVPIDGRITLRVRDENDAN